MIKFVVWDEDDLRTDDKVGTGWMSVNDYVDRGQGTTLIIINIINIIMKC